MRTIHVVAFTSLTSLASLLCAAPYAFAQVSDTERAGARELFKEGDQLQRAGHFAEALDKFQRAQQVYAAPTNLLRIAECDAALGKLVASAETYREILRTPLPAGSPPAFQAAVDQAKAELSQVDPRMPKVTVQVQPSGVQGAQMQIDGQNVSGALIGEAMPVDPGSHKIAVVAPGYSSSEQQVDLKERDEKTVALTLTANPQGAAVAATPGAGATAGPPPVAGATPPPPPPVVAPDLGPTQPLRSRTGLLFGLHLGYESAGGKVPTPNEPDAQDANAVGEGGLSFGLDGGLRFARNWYVGLTFDRSDLGRASDSNLPNDPMSGGKVTGASSSTTALGILIAVIANPDRVSFYGELGLADRWFDVRETVTDPNTGQSNSKNQLYSGAEFTLGLGIWIPVGRSFRLLPKFTLGIGQLGEDANDSQANVRTTYTAVSDFGMIGLAGFYNLDL
jgi:hypothetical protein